MNLKETNTKSYPASGKIKLMIKITDITKKYEQTVAVNIPNLEIKQGELIGLIGNNGAGKTTLLRLMLDLVRADKGWVEFKNENVAHSEKWKIYTAAYIDEGFIINYLTPHEYFYFIGKLHNLPKVEIDILLEGFETFFNGAISQNKLIRDISKGNQFKVGIVACLLQDPEILILDEPFANLDPSSQLRLLNILKELNDIKRVTILISSHDINHVASLCKRILLMENGVIIKDLQSDSKTLNEMEEYFKL